jgi:hypothetical protein
MLPATPPRSKTWGEIVAPIKEGENGWRPYALQIDLDELGYALEADGAFGAATKKAVAAFQKATKLTADGIAGPATQAKVLALLGSRVHEDLPTVPDGLMRGFAEGEGANVLAATNWTVSGGVDCGSMQYRVFGPPYSAGRMEFAFDGLAAMKSAGLAKRIAIMAHNWPAGAQSIAGKGTCSSPTAPATWVAASTKFPDGAPVRTRQEWCEFYAMGGRHGEASIPKYVKSWF